MMFCRGCDTLKDSGLRCTCGALLCPACYESHACPAVNVALWPNQEYGIDHVLDDLARGEKAICMTSPTGGGKTRTTAEIVKKVVNDFNWRVILFTNRTLLTKQGARTFEAAGIDHGIIAGGYPMDLLKRVQVASAQGLNARIGRGKIELPYCDLAIIDECHRRDFDPFLKTYAERGTPRLGITATPLNIGDLYTKLIVAGTNSELRSYKAIVPCDVFAPSEPDMRGVKMVKGEFVHKGMVQRVMQCICFADVFDAWRKNNPWAAPTMLFAPGVPESKWFVEEFIRRGVKAAHIDGETAESERQEILEAHKEGDIKVLSSFGVMREGADLPWVCYGILVQVCGALSTYLQIVGRLLRSYPDKDRATLQDHSGCWWRHGSPNMDRQWQLGQTDKQIAKDRKLARQRGEQPEPICCPKCAGIRMVGPKCPHCGYEHKRSVRAVRMMDGNLKKMTGDVIKPKIQPSQDERNWKSCLYSAALSGFTISQAAGLFNKRVGRWPEGLANLPERGSVDWNRKAGEVFPWLLKRRVKA